MTAPAPGRAGPITGQQRRVHLDQPAGSVHEMYANFSITPWLAGGERRGVVGVGFDAETAAPVRQELLRRSRGGTVGLTVDLSAVTHLSSAGVSALHHIATRHAEQ